MTNVALFFHQHEMIAYDLYIDKCMGAFHKEETLDHRWHGGPFIPLAIILFLPVIRMLQFIFNMHLWKVEKNHDFDQL